MTGHPDVCYRLVADAGALVDGDADRLAQLASNLLSNARSHGERTAPIDIVVAAGAKEATFSVSNVAEALDQATVRSLYQPFKAASVHNAHNRGGMGLGLYIAERIVTEHGGTLAYAHAQGRVTFTVTLALAAGAGG
nr:ATP-binding protein [Massilia violaceinigra]